MRTRRNKKAKKSLVRGLSRRYIWIFTMVFIILAIGITLTFNHYIFRDIKADISSIYFPAMSRLEEADSDFVYRLYGDNIISKGFMEYYDGQYRLLETSGVNIPSIEEIDSNTAAARLVSMIRDRTMIFTVIVPSGYGTKHYLMFFIKMDMSGYLRESSMGSAYLITMIFIGLLYAAGIAGLLIFGNSQARKALKPIKDMTILAGSINEKDLSLRLDVESAEYELKDLCVTFNGMLDRLQRIYLKQKGFISDASHELRTPISVIAGYANMLKRWGKSDEKILNESIGAILSETGNMKNLVEALLFLIRNDENAIEYENKKVDISGLLDDITRETEIMDKNIHEISSEVAEGLNIEGDAGKLKQCIRIFIDNALKYSPPASKLLIVGREDNGLVKIEITDKGYGIGEKHLGHIFNRFYRADISRSKKTGGIGLGLPIARAIVLGNGGKINVTTKENKGTSVVISLPVIPNNAG